MYSTKYAMQMAEEKRRRKLLLLAIFLLCLLASCYYMLSREVKEETVTLIGRWQSQETGVILSFNEEGDVIFDAGMPTGSYHIISPSLMEYTIGGKTFSMNYELVDASNLKWGLEKEKMEVFIKK